MSLEELVGQKLMIGVSGTRINSEMIKIFEETHAGGLILYRPNFSSAERLKRLISDLEEALGRRLLVAVDHEGGRVIHLAEGVTVFPDNLALGATQNEGYARKQGEIEALELRRLGIDLNLAPTLDVLTETFSPNIGIRSYARDPDLVSKLGTARIRGMQASGLSACAKHFPGQGHSPLDAHLGLPVLSTTWDEMRKIHIKPFIEAIRSGVDTVMSSHPVYPNLDPAPRCPATFSKRIIQGYLREELGFRGVILSDDLEMGALKEICSASEAAYRAVEAGHDIILLCHDSKVQREAYHSLFRAYRDKSLSHAGLEESVERIQNLKTKRTERFGRGEPIPEREGQYLAEKIARESVRISKNKSIAPFNASWSEAHSISVIFPQISVLKNLIMIEKSLLDEKAFLKEIFSARGLVPKQIEMVGLDPLEEEIEKVVSAVNSSDLAIFFCYDAHLYPQCRKLLDAVQSVSKQCLVVLLRDPYDEEFVKEESTCATAFGFRAVQIKAVINSLFSLSSLNAAAR